MRIGLIDFDGKQVNLAIMKISTWHKQRGDTVVLNNFPSEDVDKVYVSVLFEKNRDEAFSLASSFDNFEIGGTGWDLTTELPIEVEDCKPDYDLYTVEDIAPRIRGIMKKETRLKKAGQIVNAGIGFISRGCIRRCPFCVVPKKEGHIHRVGNVSDVINPRSNIITLLDANLTSNPDIDEILSEIIERELIVDLTQGVDIKIITPEVAEKLSRVSFLRSLHYAWDMMPFEKRVLKGIDILSKHIKKWRHMCYMLVGFDTTWEEDYYRFHKLAREIKVDPYVMIYNGKQPSIKIKHFARWVNGRIYKKCSFDEYRPWVKAQAEGVI